MALNLRLTRRAQVIFFIFLALFAAAIAGGAVWYLNSRDTQVAPDDSSASESTCQLNGGDSYCETTHGAPKLNAHWKCQNSSTSTDTGCEQHCNDGYRWAEDFSQCISVEENPVCLEERSRPYDGAVDRTYVFFCNQLSCTESGGVNALRCDNSNSITFFETPGRLEADHCSVLPQSADGRRYLEVNGQRKDCRCFAYQVDWANSSGVAQGWTMGDPSLFGADCDIPVGGFCGDGILDAGEQCDDGNNVNGDGCSSTCQTEVTTPSCTVTHGFQCLENGRVRVSWNATPTGFTISPTTGRVVVRLDNKKDPWHTAGSDIWWSTHYNEYVVSGRNPANGSWDFPIVSDDTYGVRVTVDVDNSTTTFGGTCNTGEPTFSCEGNDAPECSGVTSSASTVQNGTSTTLTAAVSDPDNNLEEVNFYWAETQTNNNYCAAAIWNLIGEGTNAGNGNWTYNWNITGIPTSGAIVVAANVYDTDGAWCTGNPSGVCGNDTTACPNCSLTLSIDQPVCEAIRLSSTSIRNGQSLTVTVNTSDQGNQITSVPLYWVPQATGGTSYCASTTWNSIGNATKGSNGIWTYTWNVSGLPSEGGIRVFANINGAGNEMFCTGFPYLSCNLGETCPTCSANATITTEIPPECGTVCTTNAQCPGSLSCIGGSCLNSQCSATGTHNNCECITTPPPNECGESCTTNAQCGTGLSCVGGMCRNPQCTGEADCICNAGPSCGASCTSDSQCGDGYSCSNGMCRNPSCTEKANCLCDVPKTSVFDGTRNKIIAGFSLISISLAYMLFDGFDRVLLAYTSKEHRLKYSKESFESKVADPKE